MGLSSDALTRTRRIVNDMRDRPEERWARDVLVAELGVPADLYDNGRTQGMPDVLIHGPSGIEPLEVVTAHDDEYLRMSAALKQLGRRIDIAPSSQAWAVSLIHARANAKRLRRQLPGLIIEHETLLRLEVIPEALERLGIEDPWTASTATSGSCRRAGIAGTTSTH